MKLPFTSFRSKLALTLIVVIAIVSSASFYFFNSALSERIYAKKEKFASSILSLLRDELYFTINIHDGRIIKSIVKNMSENNIVINAFLVNEKGKVRYPAVYTHLRNDTIELVNKTITTDSITLKRYNQHILPFSRAFIPLNNAHGCQRCHSASEKNLGFIILDISNKDVERNLYFTRKFSIVFSLIMIAIISVFVFFMHYKFVRKSLSKFQSSIAKINNGNLDERLEIHDTKELGNLAESFNNMLDKFQHAQKELKLYHEKALSDAHKLATVGEMAARLAHEIRNPMTGISNAVEIIIKETNEKDNIPILEEIRRQTDRVNNAITDLLKFSKPREIMFNKNSIIELINNIVFFLDNQAQYKNILIIKNTKNEVPDFEFDSQQMENVFMNLALNAIQAMQYTGRLTFDISFEVNEDAVVISVTDSGPGIEPAKLSEIFRPFFTTRTEGTGLGLAIVKEIVEKHGGYVKVHNNFDTGATFTVYLPVNKNNGNNIYI